jgi:hypothetical protein
MYFTGDGHYDLGSDAVDFSSTGAVSSHCPESALRSPCEQDTWTCFVSTCWISTAFVTGTEKQ